MDFKKIVVSIEGFPYEKRVYELKKLLSQVDSMTYFHSWRVSEYFKHFFIFFDLTEEEKRQLIDVCFIHDIGKLLIDKNIIYKRSSLTEEEKSIIREHPFNGYRLAKRLSIKNEYIDLIFSHHERWDGRGYPCHLIEDALSLESQVLSLCDTLDAMTSLRSYQSMYSFENAFNEIVKNRNKQFSSEVLDMFFSTNHNLVEQYNNFHLANLLHK